MRNELLLFIKSLPFKQERFFSSVQKLIFRSFVCQQQRSWLAITAKPELWFLDLVFHVFIALRYQTGGK